jgi:hypothetical protein
MAEASPDAQQAELLAVLRQLEAEEGSPLLPPQRPE